MITLEQAEQIVLNYNSNEAIFDLYGETHLVREKTEEHDWGWVFTFDGNGADWREIVRKRGMLQYVVERRKGMMGRVGSAGLRVAITSLLIDAKEADRRDDEHE